jgi:hypothetical protein
MTFSDDQPVNVLLFPGQPLLFFGGQFAVHLEDDPEKRKLE